MSKPKPNRNTLRLNRLKELFDETLLLQPEPGDAPHSDAPYPVEADLQGTAAPPERIFFSGDHEPPITPNPASHQEELPAPNVPPKGKGRSAPHRVPGWEGFLDAIHRDEHIGFSYEQRIEDGENTGVRAEKDGEGIGDGTDSYPGSRLSAPLIAGNEIFGSIELEGNPDRPWMEQEAGLVNSVAQQIGLHLENLRLLTQAEQFKQEAEQAVRRITREGWESFFQAESGPVQGYEYDRNRVLPLETGTSLEIDSNKGRRRKKKTRASEGNLADHPADIHPAAAWPIKVREETIGELVVEYLAESPTSELAASNLAEEVAGRLSVHIESLRLLEETERARQQLDRRAAELETVARVSTASATILDPATLLQSVVNLTKDSFKLYGVHIYLMEEHTGRLILAAMASKAVGATPGVQTTPRDKHVIHLDWEGADKVQVDKYPAGKFSNAVGKVARVRRGLIIDDVRAHPEYQSYPHLPDALSELAVPMIVGDQVIGVFGVLSETANRFYADDMRTFSTLASQVAIALRNAELYAEQMATVARLRELDHLKSAFLANMSHELRTPLNSILGFAQVILEEIDGPLTYEMRNDLQLIEKNGNHLLRLINDVLDMAKIEAGRMSLSFETFNLRELLQDVLETAGPLARDKSLYLQLMVNPLESLQITADRFRLRQILLNLVGNSVKFTESGGITILAEQLEKTILLSIHDTGIGIPPDKLETVFEAFSQVDISTTRKAGGTGLGLPISRRLVEMHGGRLWAESSGKPGEGSTFFLDLPVDARHLDAGNQTMDNSGVSA